MSNINKKKFNVNPLWSYETESEGISHLSLSYDNKTLSISQFDGNIQIVSSITGRISYTVHFIDKNAAVTCSRFHPKERMILITGTSGHTCLCQYQSGNYVSSNKIEDTPIYACDFSKTGKVYATAGKDANVRVYDTETGKLVKSYSLDNRNVGATTECVHNSRIYCIISDPNDENRFISGGWDQKVIFWDIRQNDGVAHIGGPNICGDAIDIKGNKLLTGSWRSENQLEIWDIRSMKNLSLLKSGTDQFQVYGAKFARKSNFFVAGGSECSNIRTFDDNINPLERLGFFDGSVTAVAIEPEGKTLFAASQNGKCFAFSSAT